MLAVLTADKTFENTAEADPFMPRPQGRTLTRFEVRGQRLGHGVRDLVFRRTPR
jgi:tRNA (guanine-N7-)-methyltransferase